MDNNAKFYHCLYSLLESGHSVATIVDRIDSESMVWFDDYGRLVEPDDEIKNKIKQLLKEHFKQQKIFDQEQNGVSNEYWDNWHSMEEPPMIDHPLLRAGWFTLHQNNKKTTVETPATLLPKKEKHSMLKLIITMAMEKYKYDPNSGNKQAATGTKIGSIHADINKYMEMDQATVRKYVKMAGEFYIENKK